MNNRVRQIVRRCAPALLLAWLPLSTPGQEVKRPPCRVPEIADTALQLAPPGWRAEKEMLAEVDLNGDGRPDAALVISNGGFEEKRPLDFPPVKHVLVLALRSGDGKLHPSIVSDAAILDGDEGGVFGDPLESVSIDRGTVVISHYGGSRDRWGYTHRYRYQNGQWMLIGLDFGNTDSLDLEHYDNHDINLITGLVGASEKGNYEGEPKRPEVEGAYYELQVLPVDKGPTIDGRVTPGEWTGYTMQLNHRQQVYRKRQLWRGRDDLSAELHAVRAGEDLFICAQVTDDEVTAGDTIRLVTKKGVAIKTRESRIRPAAKGYVFEARYSLKEIVAALKKDNQYVVDEEAAENVFSSLVEARDLKGLELPVSVEVVDVDRFTMPRARGVLSTRLSGSHYSGGIRIYREGTLVLVSDKEQ